MLTGHLNATRFAQKPIPQPTYSFSHVPKPDRTLKCSVVQNVQNREDFQWCMAEMLLICKEAMRRRPEQKATGGSKPLSLEYLADRMDIDDPCFGYLVRTNEQPGNETNWKKGMLQGFITVTTFTNWQKSFEWNSTNTAAYECDSGDLAVSSGLRKWDEDGTLASKMQESVRCGDIWNEGIVWPRIAEISLLGALGCGRALVSLIIEDLECMKASAKANYDFVVLQATDNSIPFYESLGFVRVGTVMKDDVERATKNSRNEKNEENLKEEPLDTEIISSEVSSYTIKKAGESIIEISRKLKVDPWDIAFLNQHLVAQIGLYTKFYKGTVLFVPVLPKADEPTEEEIATDVPSPTWHVAKENETPRTIAKKFGVSCIDVVEANKRRLPELVSSSRLKDGTRIKVSHFHIPENEYKPYSHWSFPDDEFEDGEPSYMMVRKLNRRKGTSSVQRPIRESLLASFSPYEKTDLLLSSLPESPAPVHQTASSVKASTVKQPITNSKTNRPTFPDMPRSAFMIFLEEQQELAGNEMNGLSLGEVSKAFGDLWRDMPVTIKERYEKMAAETREEFEKGKRDYELAYNKIPDTHCTSSTTDEQTGSLSLIPPATESSINRQTQFTLYNAVVKLKPGAMTECSEYKYWYVLTFIPDLKWCHLAPMIEVGKFGSDKPRAHGKTKWKLVDESLGKEVDISSSFCIPIKSKSMRKTLDADKEEWDIIDDGTAPSLNMNISKSRASLLEHYDSDSMTRSSCKDLSDMRSNRKTPAIKPSVERKRKRTSGVKSPFLQDDIPVVSVPSDGRRIMEESFSQRKRSRSVKSVFTPLLDEKQSIDSQTSSSTGERSITTQEYSADDDSLSKNSVIIGDENISSRPKRASVARLNHAESSTETYDSNDETLESFVCETSSESDTLTEDETESESIANVRRSPRSKKIIKTSTPVRSNVRPRRSAAPTFLGELTEPIIDEKSTPRRSNRATPATRSSINIDIETNSMKNCTPETRSSKAASLFIGESLPRRPRNVNSAGSRRSVLQD